MYREFRTYDTIPYSASVKKKNYTDTADTGSDYLCSTYYDELPTGNYITDVLYTKKPMEYTEPKTSEMLAKNGTKEAVIESNNGGQGFARNVESQLREMGNTLVWIRWFFQGNNKHVRIFTKSADVNNMTFFPADWERRWPEFARDIKAYGKEGKNAQDDAQDALTGTVEKRDDLNLFNGILRISRPDRLSDHFLFIAPFIEGRFVALSAYIHESFIFVDDIIFNTEGVRNKSKLARLLTSDTTFIYESPKEWFEFGREIRAELIADMRIVKPKANPDIIIASMVQNLNKTIIMSTTTDPEYQQFVNSMYDYRPEGDQSVVYCLIRAITQSKIIFYSINL